MMGVRDEDTVSSLAGRLARLDKQLDHKEQRAHQGGAGGVALADIVRGLLDAIDPDRIEASRDAQPPAARSRPTRRRDQARDKLVGQAANVFTGPLIELLDDIRREKEQTIDHDNLDTLLEAEWSGDAKENAEAMAKDFARIPRRAPRPDRGADDLLQPTRAPLGSHLRHDQGAARCAQDRPPKARTARVWRAYALLDEYKGPTRQRTDGARGADPPRLRHRRRSSRPMPTRVRRNFQNWILKRHSGAGEKFTDEQMDWLRMIRDHIATSIHIERDDLDMAPFDAKGGLGKMHQLFGDGHG